MKVNKIIGFFIIILFSSMPFASTSTYAENTLSMIPPPLCGPHSAKAKAAAAAKAHAKKVKNVDTSVTPASGT